MSECSIAAVQKPAAPASSPALAGILQRQCACGQHATGGECEDCKKKKEKLQRNAGYQGVVPVIPSAVHQVLNSPGQPLDAGNREFMESRFRHDFSRVRVHTDAAAAQSAEAVSANAYTVANQIVFNQSRYAPESVPGRKLLAHELAHVVQQSRGGVPTGIDGDSGLESAADRAANEVASESLTIQIRGASGVGVHRDAKAGGEVLYEVKFPDGTRQLTAAEFEAQKQEAIRRLRSRLRLVAELAENGRNSQIDMLKEYQGGVESLWDVVKKPKALIGIAADIKAGVTPPYIGMWGNAKGVAERGLAALDRGDLGEGARLLRLADSNYRDSMHEWNAYREATIGGAEAVASNLETVRDVSFAIALVAGAAVAAPVIAGAVGAAGVTGVTATGLTALGTAGTTGALGVGLGGGSSALGSYSSAGKVDWHAAAKEAKRFGKQGAVTGLTAGLGSALGASGKAAELAKPLVQQALRRCLTEAGVNVTGEITTLALDRVLPDQPHAVPPADHSSDPPPQPLLPGPARAALTGCVSGAVGVPVGKIGSAGLRKGAELAVGAGVSYADARLSGQGNAEALAAATQGLITSAAIQHGHAGTEHKAAQKRIGAARQPHDTVPKAVKPSKAQAAGPIEPTKNPLAEKLEAHAKASAAADVAPAIIKEDALAKKPTGDGHEAVVTKMGVAKCSPSPCPVIHVEYAKELAEFPLLRKKNAEIQALRKTNPDKAAEKAATLIRALEGVREIRAKGGSSENVGFGHVSSEVEQLFGEAQGMVPEQAAARSRGTRTRRGTSERPTLTLSHPDVLRESLERAGIPVPEGHDPHHIVATKGGGQAGDRARAVLEREGIHGDSEPNGVPLPRTSTDPRTVPEGFSRHQTIHTKRYYRALARRLESAPPGTVRDMLRTIRNQIREGTFPH